MEPVTCTGFQFGLCVCAGSLPKLDFLMSISSDGSRREGIVRESHRLMCSLDNSLHSLSAAQKLIDSAERGSACLLSIQTIIYFVFEYILISAFACRDMYELALWTAEDVKLVSAPLYLSPLLSLLCLSPLPLSSPSLSSPSLRSLSPLPLSSPSLCYLCPLPLSSTSVLSLPPLLYLSLPPLPPSSTLPLPPSSPSLLCSTSLLYSTAPSLSPLLLLLSLNFCLKESLLQEWHK